MLCMSVNKIHPIRGIYETLSMVMTMTLVLRCSGPSNAFFLYKDKYLNLIRREKKIIQSEDPT